MDRDQCMYIHVGIAFLPVTIHVVCALVCSVCDQLVHRKRVPVICCQEEYTGELNWDTYTCLLTHCVCIVAVYVLWLCGYRST